MNPLELKVVQVILEDIACRPPEQHLTIEGQQLLEAKVRVLLADYR
jgi:hypothetical protein